VEVGVDARGGGAWRCRLVAVPPRVAIRDVVVAGADAGASASSPSSSLGTVAAVFPNEVSFPLLDGDGDSVAAAAPAADVPRVVGGREAAAEATHGRDSSTGAPAVDGDSTASVSAAHVPTVVAVTDDVAATPTLRHHTASSPANVIAADPAVGAAPSVVATLDGAAVVLEPLRGRGTALVRFSPPLALLRVEAEAALAARWRVAPRSVRTQWRASIAEALQPRLELVREAHAAFFVGLQWDDDAGGGGGAGGESLALPKCGRVRVTRAPSGADAAWAGVAIGVVQPRLQLVRATAGGGGDDDDAAGRVREQVRAICRRLVAVCSPLQVTVTPVGSGKAAVLRLRVVAS